MSALDLLRAAGGQVSFSSPLGRWARLACLKFDIGAPGVRLTDVLRASQVSLSSPLGQWAMRLSQMIDAGLIDLTIFDALKASGGTQQISSPFGSLERYLSGA